MKSVSDLPVLLVNRFEADRLLGQHLRDIKEPPLPSDLAIVAHPLNDHLGVILNGRQFARERTWRDRVKAGGSLTVQSFMGTFPVILLLKAVKILLLVPLRWLGWDLVFEGSVHPFMTTVLAGLTRFDPLRTDTQLNPPFRQLTESADRERSEGRTVIGANRLRQAVLAKHPLKPRSNRSITGALQRPAQQQIREKLSVMVRG
jgi:hypothetical protein